METKICDIVLSVSPERMAILVALKFRGLNSSAYNLTLRESMIMPVVENITYPEGVQIKTCTTKIGNNTLSVSSNTYVQVYAWVALITAVAGIIGNFFVILANVCSHRRMDTYKFLIVHLLACDFIFATLQLILSASTLHSDDWIYGNAPCRVFGALNTLGSLVAIGTILLIAKERFSRTVLWFNHQRVHVKKRNIMFLSGVWIAGLLSVAPIVRVSTFDTSRQDCVENWDQLGGKTGEKTFALYLLIVFFVFPMGLIIYYYGHIIKEMIISFRETNEITSHVINTEYLDERRKHDQRITRILLSITVLFCLCVSPIRIFRVVRAFLNIDTLSHAEYHALIYTCLLPYPFHVAVNPVVYGTFDRTFITDFINFVTCRRTRSLSGCEITTPKTRWVRLSTFRRTESES